MSDDRERARELLHEFRDEAYVFGLGCIDEVGALASRAGRRVAFVAGGAGKDWGRELRDVVKRSLAGAGVDLAGDVIPGARPNSPREDVGRTADALLEREADAVLVAGGGSTIDCAKAATALAALVTLETPDRSVTSGTMSGGRRPDVKDVEDLFGVGRVTAMLEAEGARMPPLVAVQLASGSAAHLTKYANVTDTATHQKKLIVDEAVIPAQALFDYAMTTTMSPEFTADGALDGVAHALEVFYGARGEVLERVRPVATLAIELIVGSLARACADPLDMGAREALGLGTDLGGHCIMMGGTNGGHLTSFSLVDLLPHGRACAVMNPYYTVLFAPAIEPQLRDTAAVLARAGYLDGDASTIARLEGRDLGVAVARALQALSREAGLPTTLAEVEGFTDAHVVRALAAAKDPKLEMKLRSMPVPLSADTVDDYMGPVLEAARTGDFSVIRTPPGIPVRKTRRGRPVYTAEDRAGMERPLPPEPDG